ncbi:TonB-dependent receptor [Rhodohalobacter sp. SW132]|uniref:TonB-dependent receptor n=1 Tax=Rhodohalobacter sp. SW132 TaxID=2293433 RepID=UPI000E25AFCA|nr:TonB-dependent receptor [Rhodohalobacter sp. SW132]REL24342.1 TonB-dependent receptor [Rhodohalobacter sp. SW132]
MMKFLTIPFLFLLFFSVYQNAEANDERSGVLSGIVVDIESSEPVPYVYLHLEEINRSSTTDRDGRFELRNLPAGSYTVNIHRIGYTSQNRTVDIQADERTEISFQITPTVLSGQTVEVVGDAEQTVGGNLEHASLKIVGDRLRRDLDVTLSGTLSNQAGFSERSMGAAPGRPVMRGLGDERVLILEDGGRTGDVSWTSSDHSVTVDPSSADEIEIARGPAALEHGAGAIGGVINVVSNKIPNSIPTRTTGNVSFQGASVNNGMMGSGSVKVPYRDLVLNVDLSGRIGQDYKIPDGTLTNTSIRTADNGFGIGYIRPWGYAGLSGSVYYSEYGIPPDPEGGHPAGVDIEMYKYHTEGRAEVLLNNRWFNLLEARGSFIHYHHVELESSGAIGTQYDMDTTTGTLKLRNNGWGFFNEGVVGIWGEFVDYSVFGSRTPNSNSVSGAFFAIQEADIGNLHLEAGLRLNHFTATPERERPNSFIGHVRQRNFTGLESSASAIYNLGNGWYLGSTFMHSWRSPTLEELYSEGPHLAAFAYEVGNPDLEAERGLGSEIFARYKSGSASVELATYYNYFGNYLYAQDTGRPSIPRGDLNEFKYIGTQATMYGAEFSSEVRLIRNLVLDGNISFTIGDRVVPGEEREAAGLTEANQPLPMMPPVKGNFGLRYSFDNITLGTRMRAAASQSRIGENETPTDGYAVFDLNAQYRFDWGGTLHTFALNGSNLFNTEYYNHLSKVKDLFPEPARSVSILYRVYF